MIPAEPEWLGAWQPPYYAVIFTSKRSLLAQSTTFGDSYEAAAAEMERLAQGQPGFLGIESYRNEANVGVTISYWRTAADLERWGKEARHLLAQRAGRDHWYEAYSLRVARVERESVFEPERKAP